VPSSEPGTQRPQAASSTAAVAQRIPRRRSKMADRIKQAFDFVCRRPHVSPLQMISQLTSLFFLPPVQPVEYDTPTDVITLCTSGPKGKPAIYWFWLGITFSGSKPIYFWSKCSAARFNMRGANRNGNRFHLGGKGAPVTWEVVLKYYTQKIRHAKH